jgi:hypothetical protein
VRVKNEPVISIQIGRRGALGLGLVLILAILFLALPTRLEAQKVQENFKEKFPITKDTAGVGIATSSDGKWVYVVGAEGILVSDDFGKMGSWVQTVRLK